MVDRPVVPVGSITGSQRVNADDGNVAKAVVGSRKFEDERNRLLLGDGRTQAAGQPAEASKSRATR